MKYRELGGKGDKMNLALGITSVQKPNHSIKDDVTKSIRLSFYNMDSRGEPFRHVSTQINLEENNMEVAKKFRKLADEIETLK